MIKGFTFALTTCVIFAILTILTYHLFFNNTTGLILLLFLEAISFTINIAVILYAIEHKWED